MYICVLRIILSSLFDPQVIFLIGNKSDLEGPGEFEDPSSTVPYIVIHVHLL